MEKVHRVQSSSSKFLKFIINDLLDLARIKHGKFHKNVVEVNVKQVIEEVISINEFIARQQKVALNFELHNLEAVKFTL